MADGSVRVISDKIDPKLLEGLMTISGGATVDLRNQGDRQ